MKRKLYLQSAVFFGLLVCTIALVNSLSVHKAEAISIVSNPGASNNLSIGNTSATLRVANCDDNTAPAYEAYYFCQANYFNNTNFDLFESGSPSNTPKITVNWQATCLNGSAGGLFSGTNNEPISGSFSYSCVNPSPNPPSGTFYITPISYDCHLYNYTFCRVTLKLSAVNPSYPPNYLGTKYNGGNAQVAISITSSAKIIDVQDGSVSNNYAGQNPATSVNNSFGYNPNAVVNQSQGWTSNANPATPYISNTYDTEFQDCSYKGTAYIGWQGTTWNMQSSLDQPGGSNGNYITGSPNESFTLMNLSNGQPATSWLNDVTKAALDSGSTPGSASSAQAIDDMNNVYSSQFPASPNTVYSWQWSGFPSSTGTPVSMSIPFPSLGVPCLTPESKVTNGSGTSLDGSSLSSGQKAYFQNRIVASGYKSTTFGWTVEGCYYSVVSNPTTNYKQYCSKNTNYQTVKNNSSQNCVLPVTNPNPPPQSFYLNYCPSYSDGSANNVYTFPSAANAGDAYCERIAYNNTNFGTSGHSTQVCVLDGSFTGSQAQITSSCNSAEAYLGSSDTYNPNGVKNISQRYAIWVWSNDTQGSQPPQNYTPNSTWTSFDNSGAIQYSTTALPNSSTVSVDLAKLNAIMSGNLTWELVTYNYYNTSTTKYYIVDYVVQNTSSQNCYEASCTLNINGGLNQNDAVKEGQPFTVTVTMTNNGSNTIYDPMLEQNYHLSATLINNNGTWDPGGPTYIENTMNQGNLGSNGVISQTFTYTAPSSLGTFNMFMYPDYYGRGPINSIFYDGQGGSNPCQAQITTYQYTTITPGVMAQPASGQTSENMTTFEYETYGTLNGASVSDPTTSCVYYQPAGSQPPNLPTSCSGGSVQIIQGQYVNNQLTTYNQGNTYVAPSSGSPPGSYSTPPIQAGDQFCSYINLAWTTAWVDASGNAIAEGTGNGVNQINPTATGCVTIHNEPYLQAFGNDVIGDSAFVPPNISCQDTSSYGSGIYAYSNTSSSTTPQNSSGSYSQFATQALCAIEGMSSAGLLRSSSSNYLPTYLSFSNTNNINGNGTAGGDATNLGGYFGVPVSAPTQNYFRDELPNSQSLSGNSIPTTSGDYNASTTGGGSTSYVQLGNSGQGTGDVQYIYPGTKIAIFVKGNVYITNNIEYAGSNPGSAWSSNNPITGSINNIPSFWLIVSGNIYIAPNVTQLDGVYIAQPSSNNVTGPTGIIDTCAQATGAYQVSQLYGDVAQVTGNSVVHNGCNRQLTINGAIMDQATIFDRSFSSLRYSNNGNSSSPLISENPYNPSSQTCGTAGQDINGAYSSNSTFKTCAAEVINFTPEVYLSQPALEPIIGKYDYITSLPPLL